MTRDASAAGTPIEALTATEMIAAYRTGELSPVEVTTAVLERAHRLQGDLNCFFAIDDDGALAAASASEKRWLAGEPAGAIDGVPVTIKENIARAGFARPAGTKAKFDATPSTEDGPASARIVETGGVIFGITVMPDFGMLSSGVSSLHGITRSPWNRAWTVGGSSGGAGAAAAARIGPLHVGSDIGGSLRLPAGWLGLVTLKPSFGRVAVDPPYMGRAVGPMTRTVDDAALLMSVLTGADSRDYTSLGEQSIDWTDVHYPGFGDDGEQTARPLAGLRVGYHLDGGAGIPTYPTVSAAVQRAVDHFAAAGAEVTRIEPPMTVQYLRDLDRFLRVRLLADIEDLPVDRQAMILPFIREWVKGGANVSGTAALRAYQGIQSLRQATVQATEPFDLVLSPVAPVAAFPAEWPMPTNDPATSLHHIAYTAPYNFSEQPASSVNCGFAADGRPIGLQIAGRRFDDLAVMRATHWYEQTRPVDAAPQWPR